jgi:arginyl-tRNA synthetase
MNICRLLSDRISVSMRLQGISEAISIDIKPTSRAEFGDYQVNGVMEAAKQLKQKPHALAKAIVESTDLSDLAEKVEVAGPGFINIYLKNSWLAESCMSATTGNRLGIHPVKTPKNIVVDYSGPNLAKEMHVGHLRSSIIGDAIARVLKFQGHNVIRQNHVGDWGTQFGMLIAHMVSLQSENNELSMLLSDLEEFYRQAKKRFDNEPEFANTAREYVVRLQSGDLECTKLWQQFIEISLHHCEDVYERLGVELTHADVKAESSYNADLNNVVQDLQAVSLLVESEGAQCAFLEEFRKKDGTLTPIIVQKSDGGYLYATTDLAALRYRSNILNADRILYVVDVRQSLHFQQVFMLARKAEFVTSHISLEHLAFGMMLGEDGKPFKTRTGGTVKLIDLLIEAENRAFILVRGKNSELTEDECREVSRKVGIGAIKYADLSKNRLSDYVFSWSSMLSFEGNTAPYLQYAYVRIRSIFRKLEESGDANFITAIEKPSICISEPAERSLAMKLLQFEEVLDNVTNEGLPNLLCNYLYELSGRFMSFYEACPILKDNIEPDVRNSRLALSNFTEKTLKIGLELLGIEVLERM